MPPKRPKIFHFETMMDIKPRVTGGPESSQLSKGEMSTPRREVYDLGFKKIEESLGGPLGGGDRWGPKDLRT